MKLKFSVIFLFLAFISNSILNANMSLNNTVISEPMFTAFGQLSAYKSTFYGALTVNGSAIIKNSKISNKAQINGGLESLESFFGGELIVNGNLNDKGSSFNKTITIYGSASFDNSKRIDSIIIVTSNSKQAPKVTLSGSSKVEKFIEFKGMPGEVIIKNSMNVEIINGKMSS